MTVHTLKTWPDIFKAMVDGIKTFDYRKNDRDFQVGDTLRLREYVPGRRNSGRYTGRTLYVKITYILKDAPPAFGLPDGFCIMQTEKIGTRIEKGEEDIIEESRRELLYMAEERGKEITDG